MKHNTNVFINCPFDKEYRPLLRSLVFTLLYLDFIPNLSSNQSSSTVRIEEIKRLIKKSKYGIHDISRCKPMTNGDLPRFNMPFELGLDIGCLAFGNSKQKTKKILILESKRYFFQKVLSDIAGQDISSHKDSPQELIGKVRNWLLENNAKKHFHNPSRIWYAYNQFGSDLVEKLQERKYSKNEIEGMPNSEYVKFCKDWLKKFNELN